MKRIILFLAASAVAACAHGPERDAGARLKAAADAYLEAAVAAEPFLPYFGLAEAYAPDHAAMPDISPAALARFDAAEDRALAALRAIDPAALKNRGDWVTYVSLREELEASIGARVCRREWWSVNHMSGWQNGLGRIAERQPVSTAEERAAALARWSKLPAFIAQDRAHLERGLAEGYSAPKRVVRRVIAQLDGLAAAPFETHPFLGFAAASDDARFREEMAALHRNAIAPALAAYRDFLRDVYLPRARDALSISALPNGAACYEALLREYHSAEIGSEKTFARGRAAVEENTRAVIERGAALFGERDFQRILERVKTAAGNRFSSEEEVIAFTRALEPLAREKVAPFFSALPSQPVVVEPFADYLRGTGQSSRYEARPEKEGAAVYRINTDQWREQTRGEAEIVLVHEAWPGHHLQIAASANIAGLHPVTRIARSTAYVEGWARYSEALAEEAGLYASRYGEISRRAWPARGMVADPGLHAFGWTNEQTAAFLIESGRSNRQTVDVMLDRIAVIPGQLTAYDTGGLEIMALRREAETALGDRFDIRAFHDRIIENGALPLGALRAHVEAWIAAEAKE